jgi:hypothetical protein
VSGYSLPRLILIDDELIEGKFFMTDLFIMLEYVVFDVVLDR